MAKATGADLLLINPAVNRRRSTTGIGSYNNFNIPKDETPNIEVFFGEIDDVVPKEYTQEFFHQTGEHYNAYIVKRMHHCFAPWEFEFIIKNSPLIKANCEKALLKKEI